MKTLERFWSKVSISQSGCWLWEGLLTPNGYGRSGKRKNGTSIRAHRFSYEMFSGRNIPDEMTLDHLCRIRNCVNPAHLEPVTIKENVLRGTGITAVNKAKTHCSSGHEFSEENTRLWRGKRLCITCKRSSTTKHRNKLRSLK